MSQCNQQIRPRDFKEIFINNFHSVWFASVMGSGISACLLYKFPYPARWLEILGILMFGITVSLFILHNVLFVLKNFIFFRDWTFITDVKQSVFLGCYPMGLGTIINMISYLTNDDDIRWFRFIYVLFWVNVLLSVGCAWGITFMIFAKSPIQDYQKHGLNATLSLPLVTMTVSSSTGSTFFTKVPDHMKLFHLILCFMLWANTIALSFPFITIYFAKLYITKLPSKPMIFTSFIPIGVMGQGALGIALLGEFSAEYLNYNQDVASPILGTSTSTAPLAISIQVLCIFIALFLLSFGYFMTFLAVSSVTSSGLHKKFTKTWWAMTFPLGTMAAGNAKLGMLYDLRFFKIVGCIYAVATILVTTVCLFGSLFEEFPYHYWEKPTADTTLDCEYDTDDESTISGEGTV